MWAYLKKKPNIYWCKHFSQSMFARSVTVNSSMQSWIQIKTNHNLFFFFNMMHLKWMSHLCYTFYILPKPIWEAQYYSGGLTVVDWNPSGCYFCRLNLNIVLGQFKFLKAFNFNFIEFFLFFGKQIILHIKELEVVCNHNFIIMQKVQLQLFIICRLLLNESISMGIYP